MALNIVNSANYINQSGINLNSQAGQSTQANNVAHYDSKGSTVTVNARDLGLQVGQTFSGQVVGIEGNDIKLLLDNNQTINAKLDGNISAQLGQVISFEVKNTDGGQTALRPLYTNLANSLAVSNALQAASMPETAQYSRMVSAMMDEGMSVNKNSLWDMSKEIAAFPNADPKTIVQMNKLSLPINELNITQFENYKGFERQIKNDVLNMSKGLTDLMEDAVKDANPEAFTKASIEPSMSSNIVKSAGNILNAFMNAISGNREDAVGNALTTGNTPNAEGMEVAAENENVIAGEEAEQPATVVDNSGIKISAQILDLIDLSSEDLAEPVNEGVEKQINALIDEINKDSAAAKSIDENANREQVDDSAAGKELSQTETLADADNEQISQDKMSAGKALEFVKNLANEIINNEGNIPKERHNMLSRLLADNDFKNLVQNSLSKQLLLKPEQGVSNDKIQDLYNKILRQANAAMDIANNSGKDAPELMKSAQNLNDNVNFMNQLNQAVTYIQIPLMMNNKSAHGDLYVYTNKKNLKSNDGNLSALLHLDMDNLGPMDVYVALQDGTKVKTNFMLQDEATIDFISAHIDELNARLTNKGYNVSTNMTVKDGKSSPTNMAEEFLKESPDEAVRMVSKFSFDVRA